VFFFSEDGIVSFKVVPIINTSIELIILFEDICAAFVC
jgi:hypothetical protein